MRTDALDVRIALKDHELVITLVCGSCTGTETFDVDPLPIDVIAWINVLERKRSNP